MAQYLLIYFKQDDSYSVSKQSKFPELKSNDTHVNLKYKNTTWQGRILFRGSKKECEDRAVVVAEARTLKTTDEEDALHYNNILKKNFVSKFNKSSCKSPIPSPISSPLQTRSPNLVYSSSQKRASPVSSSVAKKRLNMESKMKLQLSG
jgi:hypothetical protein